MDSQQKLRDVQAAVQQFDKSTLKPTDTRITHADGAVSLETWSESHTRMTKTLDIHAAGFVVDSQPDLQVGEILPGLIMGSQDIAQDINIIKQYNVSHIVNAATGVSNSFPTLCTYKNIEVLDHPTSNIRQYFNETFQFIDEAREQGCCLVHCNAGISRAATIVIAYLMKTEGIAYQSAFDYVKSKRDVICPNPGFVRQLQQYENYLKHTSGRFSPLECPTSTLMTT